MLDLFKLFSNIEVSKISYIDIFDKYSFLNVSAADVDNVLNLFNGMEFKGCSVAVEVAQQVRKKSDKRDRYSSNGSAEKVHFSINII